MVERKIFQALLLLLLVAAPPRLARSGDGLSISPSGHYFTYRGKTVLLIGDSGTQCVMQNLNIAYRRWIDDCAERGMTAVHIWSFVAPRQKRGGSVVEGRYGYFYPGATPWARRAGGPPAADGLARWDLTRFDEGSDPAKHYWPRLRDLAAYARSKGLVLGITVFFGWPKHAEPGRNDWAYHPFNVANGGHLRDNNAVQVLAEPGKEILDQPWRDDWPAAKKTQWIWERFADKLIRELRPYGNVFYVFMDEHSYSEGNCGGHFAKFFRKRGALYVDWDRRRADVDAVYVATRTATDRNKTAVAGFAKKPPRPLLLLEGPPYGLGDPAVRRSMWTFAIGGGHFFFHDDERQGTPQTGIMSYDPNVRGGRIPYATYDWLGNMSRFFNRLIGDLDAMAPHNELVAAGGAKAYCLASPGKEYALYLPEGGTVRLDLGGAPRGAKFAAEWFDPRTGKTYGAENVAGGKKVSFTPPTRPNDDWALHLRLAEKSTNP